MKPITVPDYELIAKCGRGSYGDVYVAKSLSGSLVALKVIEKNNYSAKEFKGLQYYCSRCANSPHLIKIYHTGEMETFFYYTMELADNLGTDDNYVPATLGNRLLKDKRLPPRMVRELALNLLSGLEELHNAGLVHRDIKPENVIFVNNVPKLSDIGLVTAASATFSLGGTLGFIPPEKLKSSSGSKTETDDLYALGKLIYCAFCGNSPDKFPSLPQDIVFNDEVKRLNEVILIACNTTSPLRFYSIKQFRKALTTSVSKKRKVLNHLWLYSYLWLAGIIFSVAFIILLNPDIVSSYLTNDYVEIASSNISMPQAPEFVNYCKNANDQSISSSQAPSESNSGQGKSEAVKKMTSSIITSSINNDLEFKKLMSMQLNNSQLAECTLKIEDYLITLGCKRFPELKKEYSAYLASLAAIEELMVKHHPNMVAEIKTMVKNSRPMKVPYALIPLISSDMSNNKRIYDLFCDCAVRSANIRVIFTEKKNMLPETLEWNKFLLATRQRNCKKNQTVLYKYPLGGKKANFGQVLAAYRNLLQNMPPDKKDYYCQLAMQFLRTLKSNISTPKIVAAEYAEPPHELRLAAAKAISSFAKQNINNYVLLKYDFPKTLFRKNYDTHDYKKIGDKTQNSINNLPAVKLLREWDRNKCNRLNAMREEELKNTSNPQAAAYQKAQSVLAPYLNAITLQEQK